MTCDRSARRASRRPISIAAAPPTPASTSSKTNVGTGSLPGDDDLDREHHPRELAAGGAARDRPRFGAGVRPQQDRDVVAAVRRRLVAAASTSTASARVGHRERARARRVTASASRRGGVGAQLGEARRRVVDLGGELARPRPRAARCGRRRRRARPAAPAVSRSRARRRGSAVRADEAGEHRAALLRRSRARAHRRRRGRRGSPASSAAASASRKPALCQRLGRSARARHRGRRRARAARRALVDERRRRRASVDDSSAETSLVRLRRPRAAAPRGSTSRSARSASSASSPGCGSAASISSSALAQLARPRATRASCASRRRVEFCGSRPPRGERARGTRASACCSGGPGEAVERVALRGAERSRMLVGLAVHDDELVAELGEHADGRAPAADRPRGCGPRPRPTGRAAARRRRRRRRRPRATRSAIAPSVGHEPATLDPRLRRARAHGAGVGALAEQQAEAR